MQLPSGTLLQGGKYKIETILGQGGFGITYLATQKIMVKGSIGELETEIRVAIKEFFMKDVCNRESTSHVSVPSMGSKEMVERFKQKFIKEARNISLLKHPNIVKVLDIFEENDTAYYVMEYIQDGSLQKYVSDNKALQETEALHYIREVAAALDYIHSQHMNHLDVKPGNILRRNNAETVLIDFGLSKRYDVEGHQTSTTPVGISAGYAPMEQYKKGGVGTFSPATDIYSLGATLYYLLIGTTPPDASEVFDNDLPPLPEALSPHVRKAIQAAMEPKRSDRPQSISEFLNILDQEKKHPNKNEETAIIIEERRKKEQKEKEETKLIEEERKKPKPQNNKDSYKKTIRTGFLQRNVRIGIIVGAGSLILLLAIVIIWNTSSSSQPKIDNNLTEIISGRDQYIEKAQNCLTAAQLNLQKTQGKMDDASADSYWQALQYFHSVDSIDRMYINIPDWKAAKLDTYNIPEIRSNLCQYYQSQNEELKELASSGSSFYNDDIANNKNKIGSLNELQFYFEATIDSTANIQ